MRPSTLKFNENVLIQKWGFLQQVLVLGRNPDGTVTGYKHFLFKHLDDATQLLYVPETDTMHHLYTDKETGMETGAEVEPEMLFAYINQ